MAPDVNSIPRQSAHTISQTHCKLSIPMNDILNKSTVLVLNRHWQAIHVKTPAEAFCMMATDAATALDISDGNFLPTKWNDWLALPVRDCDHAVNTPRGPVRVPTVIVAVNYARVPLRRPRFGARGIWERDGGVCQYTGRKLAPQGRQHRPRRAAFARRQDLVGKLRARAPRSELAQSRPPPHEAGLRLRKPPDAPRALPASAFIRNHHDVSDWQHFLRFKGRKSVALFFVRLTKVGEADRFALSKSRVAKAAGCVGETPNSQR